MRIKILAVATVMILGMAAKAAPPVEEGKTIFSARCAACHNINKTLTGPALAGVNERRSIDWIIKFVHSSQTLVKSGDKTAVELFSKFNNIQMPDHPDLTEDNIKNIVEYIKSEAKAGGAEKAPFAKPTKIRPAYTPIAITNYGFFAGYLTIVAILIVALLVAVQFKEYERKVKGDI